MWKRRSGALCLSANEKHKDRCIYFHSVSEDRATLLVCLGTCEQIRKFVVNARLLSLHNHINNADRTVGPTDTKKHDMRIILTSTFKWNKVYLHKQ